jgi:two-component system chemotaxis response regulator CheB
MSIRVLIVDDSAVARKVLSDLLNADPRIEVVGVASSPALAKAKMAKCAPDVIALDAVMEPMDGVTFLRTYMATTPTPTVLVSAVGHGRIRAEALCAGALSVVEKPSGWDPGAMDRFARELCTSVRNAAGTRTRTAPRPSPSVTPPTEMPARPRTACTSAGGRPEVIAIGTSTGGAAALTRILPHFPDDAPPIVIVDHMPAGFTKEFAASLDKNCRVTVAEASYGQELRPGHVFVAPGGEFHTEVARVRGKLVIRLLDAPPVSGHRPSVNVLYRSVAKAAGSSAAAAILTGMGSDGAEGLLALRQAGAFTLAQDEATSVVYGMPKAAVALEAAMVEVPLDEVPERLLSGGGARTRRAAG